MSTQRFATGYIPDPPDVVASRAGFHLLQAKLGAVTIPAASNNGIWLPPAKGGPGILQQSQTGGCVGHALAGSITLRFAILQRMIALVSPIGCYAVGRAMARRRNAKGVLPPLTDSGTEPSLGVAGIQEWGVTSAKTWGNFPADPATINDEPTLAQLEAITEFELEGAYFLQSTKDQLYTDLVTALAAGYPVTNGIPASGDGFQGYTGGILGAQTGPNDHYTYVYDYYGWDPKNPSAVKFRCVNSWGSADTDGTDWGDGSGTYDASTAFVDQWQDMAVMNVTSSGAEQ
jgi:hypothetical protein